MYSFKVKDCRQKVKRIYASGLFFPKFEVEFYEAESEITDDKKQPNKRSEPYPISPIAMFVIGVFMGGIAGGMIGVLITGTL